MTASSQDVRGPVFPSERREDYLAIVGRQRWLVATVALSVLALVALYSYTRRPVYMARADILVAGSQSPSGATTEPNMDTEAQLASSSSVAELAAASLPLQQDPAKLVSHVGVAVPENTSILQISFTSPDPQQAAAGAEAFADAYLNFRRSEETTEATNLIQQLARTEEALRSSIQDLQVKLQDPSLSDQERSTAKSDLDHSRAQLELIQSQRLAADMVTIDPGSIVGRPDTPKAPSSPNHRLDLALGLLAGIGLAFALAYVRDRNEQRFEGSTAMERWLDAPVLAVIPRFRKERLWARSGVVQLYAANPAVAEAYRTLRTSILRISGQRRMQCIVVTSARAGEGKSTSAAMLSIALASSGKRVILIAADLRVPTVNRYMMVPTSPGLTDLLTGHIDSVKRVLQATDVAGLTVLPSGAMPLDSSPTELLQSDRMQQVLDECADADYIVLDVPSVLSVADALVLAPLADGVLFVAAARRTSPEMVELARVQLERIGAHIIGGILVGARSLEGVDPSYYTAVHPGSEMVRAAMSRRTRPRPGSSEDRGVASDGADSPANTASERSRSEPPRQARREESVERVVSIPPAETAPTASKPRSNARSSKGSSKKSQAGHTEQKKVSAPAKATPSDRRVVRPRVATRSRDAAHPAQQEVAPPPANDGPPPREAAPQQVAPPPKNAPPPPREAAPQEVASPPKNAAPATDEASPQDVASPPKTAAPATDEASPQDVASPPKTAAPPPREAAPQDVASPPKTAAPPPREAAPQDVASPPKTAAPPPREAAPQDVASPPKNAAPATSDARRKKRARQRQRANPGTSDGSRSIVLADGAGQQIAEPSLVDESSPAASPEPSHNGDAEKPQGPAT